VGAVLTGSLFLPLMGTFHTCIVVAAINLAGALFMGMDRIICPQGPAPAVRAGSLA